MEIRAIQPSEVEAVRHLLKANGWDRGVANTEEFRKLVSRSQRALVAVEGGEVIGFLRALCDFVVNLPFPPLLLSNSWEGVSLPTLFPDNDD